MKKRPFLLLLLPILASCQIDFLTDGFSYLSANAVPIRLGESPVTYYTFFDQTDAGGKNCLPPTGKSNVLVLPVEIEKAYNFFNNSGTLGPVGILPLGVIPSTRYIFKIFRVWPILTAPEPGNLVCASGDDFLKWSGNYGPSLPTEVRRT